MGLLDWKYALAGLAILLIILVLRFALRDRCKIVAKPILTQNELEFYGRLRQALPDFAILTQVSMSAFLKPAGAANSKSYYRARGRFAQKYSDFLICDPDTLSIHVVIELDDRTHDDVKDEARDRMLAEAGIETLRFASRNKPSVQQLREAVLSV